MDRPRAHRSADVAERRWSSPRRAEGGTAVSNLEHGPQRDLSGQPDLERRVALAAHNPLSSGGGFVDFDTHQP